jgi:hypothetical protein
VVCLSVKHVTYSRLQNDRRFASDVLHLPVLDRKPHSAPLWSQFARYYDLLPCTNNMLTDAISILHRTQSTQTTPEDIARVTDSKWTVQRVICLWKHGRTETSVRSWSLHRQSASKVLGVKMGRESGAFRNLL